MDENKTLGELTPEEREEWLAQLRERVGDDGIETLRKAGELLRDLQEWWNSPEIVEQRQSIATFLQGVVQIAPPVLDAMMEDEALKGITLEQAIDSGELHAALDRAVKKLQAEGTLPKDAKAEDVILPSTTSKRPKNIAFPIDKVNANIWKLLERDMGGQLRIAAESSRDKGKKELNILYTIDFGEIDKEVQITRKLEPFDKRVYVALGALWAAGNQIITIKEIFYAMGYDGTPAPNQIAKIDTSLRKMLTARVDMDNVQESKAYKYPHFAYHGNLLPMEFIQAIVNGATVDGAIHLFREPPLISFARGRKQITTIKRQLLSTPLNKTDENLMIEDYLLESIAHARSGRRNKKILYSTIYEEARITQKKQKQRAPEKIKRLLNYYQQCGHIKGYTVEADGIVLSL